MLADTAAARRRVRLHRLYAAYAEEEALVHMAVAARAVVHGDGPTDARLMFVGEAPGATEDRLGRPFCGASGRFLEEMLTSVGLARSSVFVTNCVKFRPRNGAGLNRTPTEAEMFASLPYLREEHRILGKPPIVMLGKSAQSVAERLDTSLLKMRLDMKRGEWFMMNGGYPVLPLFHPAYGIYQKANRPMMFEMFKAVLTPPVTV